MKNIAKMQAFSYGQIASAVQVLRVMEECDLDKDDLFFIKKFLEKQMVSSGPKRKKKP